ncbi:MAG: aspartate aminotransferase family protein [Phycisphaerae bacterium]|nr:aspartate aminotransferase family protein [Phycisphaerae bacterium]
MLAAHARDTFELHARHINPAMVGVLQTLGFDARFVRGEGAYLWDDEGHRYLDLLGGYAVFNIGRNHPVVRDAIEQAMRASLPNLPGIGMFRTSGILAKELCAAAPGGGGPGGLESVFFASSGAEAMDAAIKFARCSTGRARILACHRGYHGLTMGSLALCGHPEFRDGFGPLIGPVTFVPFDDLPALERELRTGDVAAFVVEPIQGKGVFIPSDEYLPEAARLCSRHGAALIADEIQTGFGRTGRMFACEHWGVEPDIMVVAKALSGGYVPVGAVLMRERINRAVFDSMQNCSRIQTTFGQNDLAMVAGLATLHVLREGKVVEHAARVGELMLNGLRRAIGAMPIVKEIRGKGLMIGIEFGRPESLSLRMGWDLLHKLDQSLFCQAILMPLMSDHRMLAQVAAHRVDIIKLIPPLVMSETDADDVARAFEKTVGACNQFPGPVWEIGKKLSSAALRRVSRGVGVAGPS